MEIELLLGPGCPHGTAADQLITTALADTRITASVTRTVIATQEAARERNFVGSPTILLDGHDPFPTDDTPVGLTCRLYATPDGLQGTPELIDLRKALKRAAATQRNQA